MGAITKAAFTREEAAEYLSIKPSAFDALRRAGKIGAVTIGAGEKRPRVRFPIRELDRFLKDECRRDIPLPDYPPPHSGTSNGLSEGGARDARRVALSVARQRRG